VRAVSTSNITLSGAQTIDGVSIIAGDRVLVAGQTTGANNGIYVAAAGAWARSTDADTSAEVKAGTALFVDEGTTYGDTQWVLTTNDAITLGTTSLTFTQFGGGTTYTAGTGLQLVGSQFSRDPAYVTTVAQGGTNATTAAAARTSLSAATVFAATIGDGSATSFNVDHSFNTRDVIVQVYQAATPWAQVFADVTLSTVNRAVVAFATAPATNAYRVVVQGLG
jgi:phage-related tail fiber protein